MARILAVEDDPVGRDLLAITLQRLGHDVLMVESASEALRRLRDWQPQAMVTDIVMPGMDGIELLREVRADYPNLPVIAVTGGCMGLIDPLAALMEALGVQVLTKPFLPVDLFAALERCAITSRGAA